MQRSGWGGSESAEEQEEDLFIFNDTIERDRAREREVQCKRVREGKRGGVRCSSTVPPTPPPSSPPLQQQQHTLLYRWYEYHVFRVLLWWYGHHEFLCFHSGFQCIWASQRQRRLNPASSSPFLLPCNASAPRFTTRRAREREREGGREREADAVLHHYTTLKIFLNNALSFFHARGHGLA